MTKLTYIGKRWVRGENDKAEKMQQCFLDDAGDIVWYPKAKASRLVGARIGTVYSVEKALPDLWSTHEVDAVSDEKRLEWQVLDRAAQARKNQLSVSSSPDLDKVVERLRMARLQMPPSRRPAFDAWLFAQLNKIG